MAKSPYPPIPLFNLTDSFVINSTNHLYVPFESTTLSIVDIVIMSIFIIAHLVAIILAFTFLRVGYLLKKQKEEVQVLKNVQSVKEQFSPSRQSMKNQQTTLTNQIGLSKMSDTNQERTDVSASCSTTVELLEVNNVSEITLSDAVINAGCTNNHVEGQSLQVNRDNRTMSNASDAQNSSTSISTTTPRSVLLNVGGEEVLNNKDNVSVQSSTVKIRQSKRLTMNQPSTHLHQQVDSDGMSKNQRILFILLLFLLFFQVTSLLLLIIHHALNFSGHVMIEDYILKRKSDIASGIISESSPIELVPSRDFRIADRFVGMFQAIVGASCYLIILYILCFIETVFIKTVQKTGTMSKKTAKIITTISVIVTVITTSLIFVSIVSSCVMILLVKSGVISDDELSASLPGAALFIFQVIFHNVIFNVVGFKVLRTIRQYSSKLNRQSSERPFYRVIVLQIGLTIFTIIHLLGAVCLALYPSWEFFDAISFAFSSIAILGYTTIIFFLYRPLFKDARIQAKEMKKLILETQHD